MKRFLILALLVAACSGPPGGTISPLTAGLNDVETPATKVAVASAPKPLSVKVTARTKSVRRSGAASVTIRTSPGARCSIDVQDASGWSKASGVTRKKTNKTGSIVWKWKVGSKTTAGTWPIYIACELRDRYGDVGTSFTVK